jgi:protease-4
MMLSHLRPPTIAVVDLHGTIGPAIRPLDYARLLMHLKEDASVPAVILNIDSPGGSASGSELITRAVGRVREEKPVVAFIGGLGASGSYMVAAAAERAIAMPSALVGSIGVISYRPLVYEALSRIGVRMNVGKAGRLKDMLSPFHEPTEEERQKEQTLLDAMYDLFVSSISRDRRLPEARVRELATGAIYTASQAVEHGLIDELGDLEDAVDWTVERTGARRRTRVVRPRRSLRDMLLGRGTTAGLGGAAALLGEAGSVMRGGMHYLYTGPGAP